MRFYTESLLSKWGFGDGDMLDDLLYDNELGSVDAHGVLIEIVKTRLIPKIKQVVNVYTVQCAHNPIRANSVNGVEVDCYNNNNDIRLEPEFIDIKDSEILEIARAI